MQFSEGLSFDDVLLIPRYSPVTPRSQISLQTNLTKKIRLNLPVISANMDAVTESAMAIAMARQGGLGIIHRFLTIQQQVQEIIKVKRAESLVIEHPYTVRPTQTVQEVKDLQRERNVSGFLVVNELQQLIGIISARDLLFAKETDQVQEIMTQQQDLITAAPTITREEAKALLYKHKIEKLPLIDDTQKIKGMITTADLRKEALYSSAVKD